jgi:hypothetical protein
MQNDYALCVDKTSTQGSHSERQPREKGPHASNRVEANKLSPSKTSAGKAESSRSQVSLLTRAHLEIRKNRLLLCTADSAVLIGKWESGDEPKCGTTVFSCFGRRLSRMCVSSTAFWVVTLPCPRFCTSLSANLIHDPGSWF